MQMTGRSPDICSLEETPEDPNQAKAPLSHMGREAEPCSSTPRAGMERASPGQRCGLGEVGLPWGPSPLSPVPRLLQSGPDFSSSLPRLPLGCEVHRHVTSPGPRGPGMRTTGWSGEAGERRAWARAGSRCSKKPDSQDFCLFGPLPFPNHASEPQDDSERHQSDLVLTPLAGLLGVPVNQTSETNFRLEWENQGKDKSCHPKLYHNYKDEIILGP